MGYFQGKGIPRRLVMLSLPSLPNISLHFLSRLDSAFPLDQYKMTIVSQLGLERSLLRPLLPHLAKLLLQFGLHSLARRIPRHLILEHDENWDAMLRQHPADDFHQFLFGHFSAILRFRHDDRAANGRRSG
jgi:hypothetical protein